MGQVLRGDAGAGVGHRDPRLAVRLGEAHRHPAAFWGVLQRVDQHVDERPLQQPRLAPHQQRPRRRGQLERHPPGLEARPQLEDHVLHQLGEGQGLGGEGPGPRLEPGEGEEVVGHPRQPRRLGAGRGQVAGAVGRAEPLPFLLQRFQVAREHRQRGAQVVRDPGHQLAPVAVGLALGGQQRPYPPRQLGEARVQTVDLVALARGRRRPAVLGGGVEALHRRLQGGEPARQPPGGARGHQRRQQHQPQPRPEREPQHGAAGHGLGHRVEGAVGEEDVDPAAPGYRRGGEDLAAAGALGVVAQERAAGLAAQEALERTQVHPLPHQRVHGGRGPDDAPPRVEQVDLDAGVGHGQLRGQRIQRARALSAHHQPRPQVQQVLGEAAVLVLGDLLMVAARGVERSPDEEGPQRQHQQREGQRQPRRQAPHPSPPPKR